MFLENLEHPRDGKFVFYSRDCLSQVVLFQYVNKGTETGQILCQLIKYEV